MKRLLSISLAVVLVLGLSIVSLPAQPAMAAPGDIYVSTTGDDITGDGTAGNPYQTIGKGISMATSGDTVYVAAGTYYENIALKSGVIVQGAGASVTTIHGTNYVVLASWVGSAAKLDGFTITGGSTNYGGGIYIWYSSPTISNNIISGNSAYRKGGGIYLHISSPTIVNNVISDNSVSGSTAGDGGGGMFLYKSSPTIVNNTISGNSAGKAGGGIYLWASSPTIKNNIITDNTAPTGGGIYKIFLGSPTIDYNDLWNNAGGNYVGTSAGPNDISQDPLFVNPGAGDYHLQATSPAIDAGSNAAVPSWLTTDFEGDPRIWDGDGDSVAVVDMGADEYYVPPTPPPPPDIEVGGDVSSVNKVALLAPWIALAAVIAAGGVTITLRRRRPLS